MRPLFINHMSAQTPRYSVDLGIAGYTKQSDPMTSRKQWSGHHRAALK